MTTESERTAVGSYFISNYPPFSQWSGERLAEVEAAMTFLGDRSDPGDVVFTDDWDVFPVYFYFNHANHYVAGLDPMFSYRHDPELWEHYRLITRGQAPTTATVKIPQRDETGKRSLIARRCSQRLRAPRYASRRRTGSHSALL